MTKANKFLRCIRLDESDAGVFERAATPGEAVVSGAFLFQGLDIEKLKGPRMQAFRNGFLGVESMGWCTLVTISESDDPALTEKLALTLAEGMVREFGAANVESVLELAKEEVSYSQTLCDGSVDTILATQRDYAKGDITEQIHALPRDASAHDNLKIWEWIDQQS